MPYVLPYLIARAGAILLLYCLESYLKLRMVTPLKPKLGWIPSRTFKSGIWILGTVRHPGSAASGLL